MKKLIIITSFFFCIKAISQNNDFKTPLFVFDSIEFNAIEFKTVLSNFNANEFSVYDESSVINSSKFSDKNSNSLYNTVVFNNKSYEYKDYSNYFAKQCGALKDGLTVDYNAKNQIVGNVLNNALNNYVIKKLFFKKKN
jgi:hypothetical protein